MSLSTTWWLVMSLRAASMREAGSCGAAAPSATVSNVPSIWWKWYHANGCVGTSSSAARGLGSSVR